MSHKAELTAQLDAGFFAVSRPSWLEIGMKYPAADTPQYILDYRRKISEIPAELRNILPSRSLSIMQLLAFIVPPPGCRASL